MKLAAVQAAVYAKLSGDATLAGLVGTRIYADVPQPLDAGDATLFPFILIGGDVASPWDARDFRGASLVAQVDVFSRAGDWIEAKNISDRCWALLHRQPLTITAATHVTTEMESVSFGMDPDGETRRGIALYRIIYQA
jgi:hypothetical protein